MKEIPIINIQTTTRDFSQKNNKLFSESFNKDNDNKILRNQDQPRDIELTRVLESSYEEEGMQKQVTNEEKETSNQVINQESNHKHRFLAYPQAVKVSPSTITYAKTTTQTVANKNIKGVKIYFSIANPNFIFYPEYSLTYKYMAFVVVDYTTSNSVGGYDILTRQDSRNLKENECSTKPASGNGEIYVPIAYINNGGFDYIASITTDLETSGKCTGIYGSYFIAISNFCCDPNPGDFNGQLTNSNNSGPITLGPGETPAFYNPNGLILGENLGLPAFSGYTKCVDLSFQLISSNPRTLALVFYEDT